MYNDLHYKIFLIDIEPWKKKNNYITYEFGRRSNTINIIDDFNVNIICDENIHSTSCSSFYLLLAIFMLFIIFIVYFMIKLFNKNTSKKYVKKSKKK